MPAYCYFDIVKIHDEVAMEDYRKNVLKTVDQYGGRYIVIGGPFSPIEGSQKPTYPVMIEFPTYEQALQWYDSEEYRGLKENRLRAVDSHAFILQGL